MIKKIEINTIPFDGTLQTMDALKTFNYFFGANGTGKTTISKIVAEPDIYPSCRIAWDDGMPLEPRVYNRDFVEHNFNSQSKLKGVFTLGEMESATIKRIESVKADIAKAADDIKNLTLTLQGDNGNGGKNSELKQLTATYKNKFWVQKQKHAGKLGGALTGYLGDSVKFMNKVLSESEGNKETLLPLAKLENKAATIFLNSLAAASTINEIEATGILAHEINPILQKRIIGKEDVDIAQMIKKLGNSDWIRQGRFYYEANDGVCPFCQQKINQDFEKSLNEYFDESFSQDNDAVNKLVSGYAADARSLQQQLQGLTDIQSEFLDSEKIKSEKQILDSIITINNQRLIQKQKEPSQVILLDSIESALSEINSLIKKANKSIEERNAVVKNLKNEKATLTKQIWRCIVEELSSEIGDYNRQKKALEAAINNLSEQIKTKGEEKSRKEVELRELHKKTTNIEQTREGINGLLTSFGFTSFKLAIGDDKKTYKLVRKNGSEAQQTLSEGERNFVTFLYFYFLLKGSQTETELANDKIVVFDDPISSLDNDVLFIVSSLIRELIQDVREKKGTIKQIFILTHNIYFHKEVTYNHKRKNGALREETFWLVKKDGINSIVEKQTTNPIKTSYELLWDEVRSPTRNKATIQNTLRRILENYFKLLGNIPLDELYKKFEGDDKVKCKALCSWVNDGSHSAFDEDFYTPLDETMITKYLEVFRLIFDQSKHISHYNMMMGISNETESIGEED
ncbi:MAG: AAA family ATPase [Syntrophomonadaceae bacterium]